MLISVQKWHSRICLRVLSCSRMSENHREPEVPEERVQVGEKFDCHATITSKELAPIHSEKSGTLQNACSTRPRVGCRFGEKCSYAHRQVDEQPTKRSKKNDDKSAVVMLKKGDWHEREPVTDECHDRPGKPGKRSDKKLGQNSSKRDLLVLPECFSNDWWTWGSENGHWTFDSLISDRN